MTTSLDVDQLASHIGRRSIATDVIHPGPANLLRLTLGLGTPELIPGDPLPAAWLPIYFLPRFGPHELRPDGTPIDTGVVPALPLPRRMFAGESARFHLPLRIGDPVRRESELTGIRATVGATGPLVFTTVASRIFGPDGLAVEEERLTVFREEVARGATSRAPRADAAPEDVAWRRRVSVDPVLLFRFSALTFNSHRVHYDRGWATEIEGYPGLVVHGPLTTALLVGFARECNPGRAVRCYSTRARRPLFDTAPFELRGRTRADGQGCELWAVTAEGAIAMSVDVELN